jgi:GNAT superfamily N-acetyltransferase
MKGIAMSASTVLSTIKDVQPFRDEYRREMNCQITKDSIHYRPGWTMQYLVSADGEPAGYGSVAVAGPWTGKPTIIEFYLLPVWRHRSFELFDSFLSVCNAEYFEVQSNAPVLPVMVDTYGRDIATEAIVFAEGLTTHHPANGAVLEAMTEERGIRNAMRDRRGGGEWRLVVDGDEVARGGILFHYNAPFGDIYMEVDERYRGRGYGGYLVQELKRVCRELGSVPCARCNLDNVASRRTLQKAGFVPIAAIVIASIARE